MRCLIIILAVVCGVLSVDAKRQKTGPAKLVRTQGAEYAQAYDTVRPASVRCSGYDKPNSATRETFFVTNLDSVDIAGLGLEIEYLDLHDRQLHQASRSIMVDIPAGQTRSVSIPSWDRSHAFHYYLSNPPQRRRSTPYKVKSRVNYVLRGR